MRFDIHENIISSLKTAELFLENNPNFEIYEDVDICMINGGN